MRILNTVVPAILCASLLACGGNSQGGGGSQNTPSEQGQIVPDENVQGEEGVTRNNARNLNLQTTKNQSIEIDLDEIAIPVRATLSIKDTPSHGEVALNSLHIASYQPKLGYVGADEFTYNLTQANGQKDLYTVTIDIKAAPTAKLEVTLERVANWKGDATAAYSIIHDDLCAWGVSAGGGMFQNWRELTDRNLVAAYGVVTSWCQEADFTEMQNMVNAGMEMVNHSHSHINLRENVEDWDTEFGLSTEVLRQRGFEVSYFVYPYDAFNDAMFAKLNNELGYLGSRGSPPGSPFGVVNTADMSTFDVLQPYRNKFDIYNEYNDPDEPRFSVYTGGSGDPLNKYVDDAVRYGGWAVRELHGIDFPESWGNVPLNIYLPHLDHVKTLVDQNSLWMDTPTNITRYRSSRAYCGDAIVNEGSISFMTPTAAGCQKYSAPLTVIISVPGSGSVKATQNGEDIPIKALGVDGTRYRYMLDIDPTRGATDITS